MTPGSVGLVCVRYEFDKAGNYSFTSQPLTYTIYKSNGTSVDNCSGLVKVTPSPASFDHLAGQSITVACTIQAEKNATGLYWSGITDCEWIPIAVGALPPSVVYPILGCIYEIDAPSSEAVTGVSDIGVALVPVG